ncbi:MAG TPA: ABC transporter permease subunit [Anaerolineales bacterium]|nr:ABC transporter permease subunit [Anaerolineales bacterium]
MAQGVLHLRAGNAEKARQWARRALQIDPASEAGWLLIAALTPLEKRSQLLRQVLTLHPGSPRILRSLRELESPKLPRIPPSTPSVLESRPPATPAYAWAKPRRRAAERSFRGLRQLAAMASRRAAELSAILVLLALLTTYGLILSEHGRQGLPAQPLESAGQAVTRTIEYFVDHPDSYIWHRYEVPALALVRTIFVNSAGLLLVALGLAFVLGVGLGTAAALIRGRGGTTLALTVSILGVSTPSFLFGMLLWVINIGVHRQFAITVLPSVGFGWDVHLIMPALVLAARPIAQIARVTHVTITEVLGAEHLRAARARGVYGFLLFLRHILRNAWIPILTTLGNSLRFSLSSLPVVEAFFEWPGVGLALLEAIELGMSPLVTDLILSLGLFFLAVNVVLEFLYPWLDARLRESETSVRRDEQDTFGQMVRLAVSELGGVGRGLLRRLRRRPSSPARGRGAPRTSAGEAPAVSSHRRPLWSHALGNAPLLAGAMLVLFFVVMAVSGTSWTAANPYQTHGVMMVEAQIDAPPFEPSETFPWGSDYIGRDIRALVLAGARQTLSLAAFATLARVGLGAILGMLAGWLAGSWFDRTVRSAIGIWAAFPGTLFAMILIQALGIQQGMGVFVIALCIVGWAEVAQYVRAEVLAIRARPYIEAARSVGLHGLQVLRRQVFPNLAAPIIVLATLEMGGVLMLLAELGYLNVFVGGGFRAMIAEGARMSPVVVHFSDVPEWGALLANIRGWWRGYPWMAWYPGLAFSAAILAFYLLGEGFRRFLQEGYVNLARVLNRFTLIPGAAVLILLSFFLRSASALSQYEDAARTFDTERALGHIRILTSSQLAGRETGSEGALLAAQYIAMEMESIGLSPGAKGTSYIQVSPNARPHSAGLPTLAVVDPQTGQRQAYRYRADFAEFTRDFAFNGEASGPVVGLAFGPDTGAPGPDPYAQRGFDLADKIVIVREQDFPTVNLMAVAGVLVAVEDPSDLEKRYLMSTYPLFAWKATPIMVVLPSVAEALLASAGSSLQGLAEMQESLDPGDVGMTTSGWQVEMSVPVETTEDRASEPYVHVMGFLPGTGSEMGLDSHVVLVAANYDGLGTAPDGRLYPGANDNASGVAAMLEMARALHESPYAPERTVMFVAWAGGERLEGFSVDNVMSARTGFNTLTVDNVIELSGLGAGRGEGLALGPNSSFRLVRLVQEAADRLGVSTTTRGRGPHYGLPYLPGFGERSGLSIFLSWDGSDTTAHTPADTFEAIDPEKLRQSGQTVLLTLFVLSRELTY